MISFRKHPDLDVVLFPIAVMRGRWLWWSAKRLTSAYHGFFGLYGGRTGRCEGLPDDGRS